MCIGRMGGGTVFGLICGLETALCVVVEWEELQSLVYFVVLIVLAGYF
jgi:hypothetical protein